MNKTYEFSTSGLNAMESDIDMLIAAFGSMDDVCEQVAIAGADEVNKAYDPRFGISVSVRKIPNGSEIVARGENVAFVEFGTGVTRNAPGAYPDRPEGISGIGEYGQGKGKQRAWGYYGDTPLLDDDKVIESNGASVVVTKGIPAAMGFVRAKARMTQKLNSAIKGKLKVKL